MSGPEDSREIAPLHPYRLDYATHPGPTAADVTKILLLKVEIDAMNRKIAELQSEIRRIWASGSRAR